MTTILSVVVFVILSEYVVNCFPDLIPEAITVYRNPEFFKNLNYGARTNYKQKPVIKSEGGHEKYKYPGETKKHNPPPYSPGFEVNYDNSPEFHHEPRDIFVDTNYHPTRKKGPYSPKYHEGRTEEPSSNSNVLKPVKETGSEEENSKESGESMENESTEEPRDFVSEFNENSEEEFRPYHEPILFARPNFDPEKSSEVVSSTYSKPYPYNRSTPLLYDEWKFYTYPKIHANEHLKSDSKFYSEEPSYNSFEDEPSSYYRYDDDTEEGSSVFDNSEFKNLGADTKHIYKKLLKPKKGSFLFKFHSKPKFKKLKFQLKKKHPHRKDWFEEYPFDF